MENIKNDATVQPSQQTKTHTRERWMYDKEFFQGTLCHISDLSLDESEDGGKCVCKDVYCDVDLLSLAATAVAVGRRKRRTSEY